MAARLRAKHTDTQVSAASQMQASRDSGRQGDEGINRSVRFPPQEEIDSKLRSGEWQLHKFKRGIILTEIKQYPKERVLLVHVLAGGGFDDWIDEAWERLKSFGREHGCSAIETLARLGLTKKLKPLGFKQTRAELRAAI